MSTSENSNGATFLAAVQSHLRALESTEQREILDELAAHLQDAIALHQASGCTAAEAETQALRAMGDAQAIGQRLRDEHLNMRLSLSGAMLNALPLVVIALLLSQTELRSFVHDLSNPSNRFPTSFLIALSPVIGVGLWLLARTRQNWPATVLGAVGILALLGVTHADGMVSHGFSGLIWLAPIALVVFPLTLGFALRWGSFRAALAILGGVAAYGCYAWLGAGQLIPTLVIGVGPLLGIIALGLTPRRWQRIATWFAFGGTWLIIVLDAFYYQHFFRVQYIDQLKAMPGYSPLESYRLPPMHIAGMVSPLFLIGSAALLVGVQAITRLQAQGRLPQRVH
ncbi:MAG TPA: permease prefix domain 1-containing protein [Nitrolancea sp.]|nr:permease prefix domain 1-containing protein [Nitrolancea sp.]